MTEYKTKRNFSEEIRKKQNSSGENSRAERKNMELFCRKTGKEAKEDSALPGGAAC